jgi:hypothetical protein
MKEEIKHICTYFDINFLPRGLALLNSLEKNAKNFKLYVLALDEDTVIYFQSLGNENVKIITLEEYGVYFKIDKSKYQNEKEFYFSLTPAVCLYILKHYSNINMILYLDADVYLFNDLEILYKEIGNASIAMCSHRIPWYIGMMSKNYGIYNVGVNAFKNDTEGILCLEQWHQDCSTWTQNQLDYPLSYFSDQIWLDKWPDLYKNIKILNHIGINVAPWNAIQYTFTKKNNQYFVNGVPLVIYHFSSLKKISTNRWHGNTSFTILNIKKTLLDIYSEYLHSIEYYSIDKNSVSKELDFSGNRLKILIYNILKIGHNHTIKINEDKINGIHHRATDI